MCRIAELVHLPRRHAPRAEPVAKRERRVRDEAEAAEYLPFTYLHHLPHEPRLNRLPIGDSPRRRLVSPDVARHSAILRADIVDKLVRASRIPYVIRDGPHESPLFMGPVPANLSFKMARE